MAKPKLELANFTGVVAKASGTTADAEIEISRIEKRPQVRTKIGDLTQLAASIKAQGVIEPVIVHAEANGTFRLIAGERRVEGSKLAGLTKIPAIIKRGLSEREIRALQVTENNEREDLTPYDQAMGVIQDVEQFGFKEATEIWNRTDAWVSKRVAVKRYAEPVLKLLNDELCGDLEVLHSLNQLLAKSEEEFQALVKRLRQHETVSREDVRGKLASVKEWERQTHERAAQKAAAAPKAPPAPAPKKGKGGDGKASPAPAQSKARAAAGSHPADAGDRERARQTQAIAGLREMLFDYGVNGRAHISSLQNHMLELGYDLPEGEWVLWSGFMDVMLPLMEALGEDRASAYVRRLQGALKNKPPADLWRELHPVRDGEDARDAAANRVPLAEKPSGWTF